MIFEYPCAIEDITSWMFCTRCFIIVSTFPHDNKNCIPNYADWGVAASILCWNEEINLWKLSIGNQVIVNQQMNTFPVNLLSASLHEWVWIMSLTVSEADDSWSKGEKWRQFPKRSIFSFTVCAFKINWVW